MTSIRLAYVVTHPITAYNLMKGQLAFMREKGLEVLLISSPGEELHLIAERENVSISTVPMHRDIHLLSDMLALFRIYRLFRKFKPHVVNASTPKAGLLGMIAARAAGVPVKIYTLRGLRLETTKGLLRKILNFTERVASSCADQVICVSESLRAKYVHTGIVPESKTTVLANGSSNGVKPFSLDVTSPASGSLRNKLGIPAGVPVIGFVGRLVRDKGIGSLLEAYDLLLPSFPGLRLVLIGGSDDTDSLSAAILHKIRSDPQIIETGPLKDPTAFYRLLSLLVFPSLREGFPNVPLEAAIAGLPTVGFRVTGTVDAVEHGVTGMLVPPGDSKALASAISAYLRDESTRAAHGKAARERAICCYQPEIIWNALYANYVNQWAKVGSSRKLN